MSWPTSASVLSLRPDLDPLASLDPALLHALTQTTHEVVTIADLAGHILFVGGAMREMTGVEPAQRVGGRLFDRSHPEDRERLRDWFADFIADPQGVDQSGVASYRNAHAEGGWRRIDTVLTRLRRSGRPALIVAHSRDVTLEALALERTAESQLRLESVIDGGDIGLVEIDLVADTASWTGDWCARHRIRVGSGPGHVGRWRALMHPEDLQRIGRDYAGRSPPEQQRWTMEYRLRDGAGRWLWVMEQSQIVAFADSGAPARAIAVLLVIDEVKKLRRELDDARERLQLSVDAAGLSVWEWDIEKNRTRRDANWYRQLQRPVPDDPVLADADASGWVHPEDLARQQEAVRAHLDGETTDFECEARWLNGDGSWRWRLSRGRILERAAAGQPLRMLGCTLDIHERKLAEQRVRASEGHYRTATEASAGYVIESRVDEFGNISAVWASVGFRAVFGCDLAEFKELGGWRVFEHPADRERMNALWARITAGYSAEADLRVVRRDGSVCWVSSVHQPLRDPASGRVTRIVSAGTDLTRRAQAQDEPSIAEAQALQRLLVDTVPACLILVEPDLTIRLAGQPLFGFSPAELRGRDYLSLFASEGHARIRAAFEQGAATRRNIELEVTPADPAHAMLDYRIHLAPIVTGGVVRGFCAVTRDITEARVRERAAFYALGNDQQRIAYDLHDGVGQQLAGVGLLVQSLTQELAQQGHPRAADAAQLARLLAHAVEDVRVLGLSLSPVGSVRHGLDSALQALAERARSSGERAVAISLDVEDATALPPLDADHVYRIAEEAVTNALRHSGAHHIWIALRLRGAQFELRIEDDGRGPGRAASAPGMGLNLMAHRARGLGATLAVATREGGGTRVSCVRGPAVPATAPD